VEETVAARPANDLAKLDSTEQDSWAVQGRRLLAALVPSTRSWRSLGVEGLTIRAPWSSETGQARRTHRGATRPMIDSNGQRLSIGTRRRRLSRARRLDAGSRAGLYASLTRVGFHGLMVAVGLTAAVTVWSGAADRLQHPDSQLDAVAAVDTADLAIDDAGDIVSLSEDTVNAVVPAGTPLQPLTRKVVEGDTLRSIASEFSVSISTILASNKLDNPDLIQPGQEILIPPVDGVVADVKQGETLAQLSERFGVQVEDVAQANALPSDPDRAIPYDRIVVPGKETADRAMGIARREGSGDPAGNAEGSVDASTSARADIVSYEVQEGDTLGQLSTQFGVSIWTILSANSLSDPDLIRPGMRLKVLPVNGVEHEIQAGESLADIADFYKVDLGPLIDFNSISDPENLRVGLRITIPGAERPQPGFSLAGGGTGPVAAPVTTASAAPSAPKPAANVATTQRTAAQTTLAQAKPQAPVAQAKPQAVAAAKPQAPTAQAKPQAVAAAKPQAAPVAQSTNRLQAAAVSAPVSVVSGGGSGSAVVGAAMKHLGARYVFGGTSPAGFDCSGFVWYVHKALGRPVSRGLWGQLNGGPRIALSALQPGDTVFFANTYMPGLSHAGIYIGGGRFIHASDEASGVKISSLSDSYWGPRYIGASRLY
jgi:cell wall-associated NlpC family hydrolase